MYFIGLLAVSWAASGASSGVLSDHLVVIEATDSAIPSYEFMIIDSIEIDNRNIYDTEDARYGGFLFCSANRLHTVTRENIIKRELLFRTGESFTRDKAEETARNLRRRFALNDAWIEVEPLGNDRLLVRVVTVDQWSLIGGLRGIYRDGNEIDYQIGFEERNFLGRNQMLSFDWFLREEDENFVTASFSEPRMIGRPFRVVMHYRNDRYNGLKQVAFGHPFYNLDQILAFSASVTASDEVEERFFSDSLIADWRNEADKASLQLNYRWGSYNRKTRISAEYIYLAQRTSQRRIFDLYQFTPSHFPADSFYHQVNLGLALEQENYIVVRRINRFTYNEDMTLGLSMEFAFGRAFKPDFHDHYHDYFEGRAAVGRQFGHNIVILNCSRSMWFRAGWDIRHVSKVNLSFYNNRLSFLTLAARSLYVSDRSDGVPLLQLGGKSGLRGYNTEYKSGEKLHVMNVEARFYSGLEIMSIAMGGAVFTDCGGTWMYGDPVKLEDYHLSIGAGLRFSLEKLTRTELIRVDVAYAQDDVWELSIGSSQYF